MRVYGVDLNNVTSTGFDVHLVADTAVKPKRSDPSFLGSIALFRHDGPQAASAGPHAGHGAAARKAADTFDVTRALVASGQTDPSKLNVVIVPYSLASTVDDQKSIVETNALKFDNIEFLSSG
ncbi:hypothetical protein [Bradyrhizobium sp.]|uniref:hypothetical protein n=1 Tax=Bradyrhizobium sp. TaxID=376 RepID=UPI002C84168E|nr:hypothetical protein [Bradyrhizobium sp.]HMM90755.1 hypothetical protein [Bradyrhizobium sp.]